MSYIKRKIMFGNAGRGLEKRADLFLLLVNNNVAFVFSHLKITFLKNSIKSLSVIVVQGKLDFYLAFLVFPR